MARTLSAIKQLLVPPGKQERRVPFGLLSGIRLRLDLKSQFQLYIGLNEYELAVWFKKLSKEINTAIDVGGAQGYYTLYFLLKTQAKTVFTFEPDPDLFQEIRSNIELNIPRNLGRLKLFRTFVGDENGNNHCSLDSLLPKIEPPCLVKIDIEGAEVDALRGATQLLQMPGVSWIIEAHGQHEEIECIQILSTHDYRITKVQPAWWRLFLPELRPADHNSWIIATK